jgi:hypothetical protein
MSTSGARVAPERVSLHRIVEKGRVGFIDATGVVRIAPALDDANAFSEGVAAARRGALWGFIDADGAWTIDAKFEEARPFKEGVARVLVTIPGERGGPPVGSAWEMIDRSGNTVTPSVPCSIDGDMRGGLTRVHLERGETKYGYLRRDGILAFAIDADSCGDFHDERAWFTRGGASRTTSYLLNGRRTEGTTLVNGPYGYLDTSGAETVAASFQSAESFNEGLAVVRRGATWVERPYAYEKPGMRITESALWTLAGGGFGFVARDGSMAIDCTFGHARRFAEGLAPAYVGGAWTDEALERDGVTTIIHALRGGHYGFIDCASRVVIEPEWDDAHPFSDGLARVLANGRWGYVSRAGDVRIPPRFSDASDFDGELGRVTNGAEWGWIGRDGAWVWKSC